jgi:hypothetical protein
MKKKNKTKIKKKTGRKLFDGKNYDEVIRKLEQVWSIGGSDEEAAFFANIAKSSLCEFLKRSPLVSERKEALKNKTILKARQEVVKGLENNPEFSLKYLERKRRNEFALKLENESKEEVSLKIEIIDAKGRSN